MTTTEPRPISQNELVLPERVEWCVVSRARRPLWSLTTSHKRSASSRAASIAPTKHLVWVGRISPPVEGVPANEPLSEGSAFGALALSKSGIKPTLWRTMGTSLGESGELPAGERAEGWGAACVRVDGGGVTRDARIPRAASADALNTDRTAASHTPMPLGRERKP